MWSYKQYRHHNYWLWWDKHSRYYKWWYKQYRYYKCVQFKEFAKKWHQSEFQSQSVGIEPSALLAFLLPSFLLGINSITWQKTWNQLTSQRQSVGMGLSALLALFIYSRSLNSNWQDQGVSVLLLLLIISVFIESFRLSPTFSFGSLFKKTKCCLCFTSCFSVLHFHFKTHPFYTSPALLEWEWRDARSSPYYLTITALDRPNTSACIISAVE